MGERYTFGWDAVELRLGGKTYAVGQLVTYDDATATVKPAGPGDQAIGQVREVHGDLTVTVEMSVNQADMDTLLDLLPAATVVARVWLVEWAPRQPWRCLAACTRCSRRCGRAEHDPAEQCVFPRHVYRARQDPAFTDHDPRRYCFG